MSAAALVMTIEGLLIALAILFIIALLRSHAEILRRLTVIEESTGGDGAASQPGSTTGPGPAAEVSARDIVGETLAGDTVKLAFGAGSPRTLLAFLSSGCAACGPLWTGLPESAPGPAGARVLVLTKGPEHESPTRLRSLAPGATEVVMSTSAWQDFAVPASPHFVLVDGATRRILGRGSATSWEQISTLVADAEADSSLAQARSSSDRAARAEQALAAAGIVAGHPSLYPSRSPGDRTSEPGQSDERGTDR